MLTWMLYGAYGRTGRLILDEALRRGHPPILAGRDAAKLQELRQVTGLTTAHLPLERSLELRGALSNVRCVVLAAGPYEVTGPLMRAACLDARCSYLDVNASVDDFREALACDEAARAKAVAVIPGSATASCSLNAWRRVRRAVCRAPRTCGCHWQRKRRDAVEPRLSALPRR